MRNLFYLLCLFISGSLFAQSAMINVSSRKTLSLNGKWNYLVDPYETGYYDYRYMPHDENKNPTNGFFLDRKQKNKSDLVEYSFDNHQTMMVPGDWNSQSEKLFYYEGTIWYRKLFKHKISNSSNRTFVHFGAANYETDVYLNGKKLGKHIGGFTPFQYEITKLLNDSVNSLVVKVDNKRRADGVPTLNTDWWNYGGITRDVSIIEVPQNYISDYRIQLRKGNQSLVSGFVQLNGTSLDQKVRIEIPELKYSGVFVTNSDGLAKVEFSLKKAELWTPEHPKLYTVNVITEADKVTDNIGFRTIETKGTDILLNGKSVFLRGICIHEENPIRGRRAFSEEDARMLLTWAKELNCNYVRLAHYPHNEYMVRLADEMGIMVWSEIPVYWTIQWENPKTLQNAQNQLTEMIARDKNRASIIIWSMANETPVKESRNTFIRSLTEVARSLDSTRLLSAAMEVKSVSGNDTKKAVEDPLSDYLDVVSFNEYIGWYAYLPSKCDKMEWDIKYQKPVLISEFGGSALHGFHADSLTRFGEEFQEDLYKHTLAMLTKIPQFRGVSPWILCDFRSPRRLLPGVQDGWNLKGLISQNGQKKKAFWVLKNFYDQKEKK